MCGRSQRHAALTVITLLVTACGGGGGGGGGEPQAAPAANRAPVIVGGDPVPAQGTALHPFSFDVSTAVSDPDGDALRYTITNSRWFTASGSRITGTPPAEESFDISVIVQDGRGGLTTATIRVTIAPNGLPEPVQIEPLLVGVGAHVNFDATNGATAFTDRDGDPLTYSLELLSPPRGLAVDGTNVVGSIDAINAVAFKLTAKDPFGATADQRFVVAAAAPEPGKPVLPAVTYHYADDTVPLPKAWGEPLAISPSWDKMPLDNPTTDAGATLGRVLFYDKRLSVTNTHACASCHEQSRGFASPERFDTGVTGVPLARNSMALANVRFNGSNRFFSDVRVETLEALALLPIQDLNELGNTLSLAQKKLAATTFYPPLFEAAFGSPEITNERIAKALAQFVRSLLTYRSRYDVTHFNGAPRGDSDLTAEELRGEALFDDAGVGLGCARCHSTHVLHKAAQAENTGLDATFTDPGARDGRFRPASLRNIAVTGPYMHDGRFATLREVIDHYDHGIRFSEELAWRLKVNDGAAPLRLNLTEEDKDALEAFLLTLTDEAFLSDPKFADPFQ